MGCKRALYIAALFTTFDLFNSFSYAFDTINQAQFLSDSANESLVSSDGNFRLGFFCPGNSQFRYVGIWFNKVSIQTVVWVANRESPIKNSEGIFKVGEDGNLGIFDGNESSPLWSTNVSIPKKPSRAKLLESGNLVLVTEHGESDTGTILWQSFDYPTDTLLPGMKFGFNRKTGRTHVLTSWKSSDDPAPGEFSGKFDHRGSPQFFLCKSSVPYYRCGPWNGRRLNGLPDAITKHQISQKVQYSNQIDLMNYTFVNDENIDVYSGFPSIVGTFTRIVLEPLGTLQRQFWHENRTWMKFWVGSQDFCDGYSRCGVNAICNLDTMVFCLCLPGFEPLHPQDWNLNCVETRKVDGCGKGFGEGFVRLKGVKWPDARNSTVYGNMTLKECEKECLKSCNCTGYASSNADESEQGCIIWYGGLKDMRQYKDEQHFYLRVDAVELAASARKNSKQFRAANSTLALIVMPISVEVLVIAAFCYYWKRRAKSKDRKEKQSRRGSSLFDSATSLSNHEDFPYSKSSSEGGNPELTLFKLSTLLAATDNFSSANKLGRGGFGPVYKGQITNRQEIAVKRLSKNSGQGIKEFKNEVLLIAKLQHRNLVRLFGYCIDEDEKMLIYEFMPNKSLDYFIFDQSRKYLLDWRKRFDIILGIARGILYLHEDSRLRIVHRDLKASNILLDAEMKPRISDFGTARIFGGDQSQANTSKIVGTFGYMSPEYVLHGIFSTKSDVFSFGVLVLEIISGKMNGSFFPDDPFSNLIKYAWELWRDGKALQIVDSSIADSCPAPEVLRCIQVGLLCVQDYAGERPAMSTVVLMLSNETTLPSPKQSTFVIKRPQDKLDPYVVGNMASINEVTITTYTAR